MNTPMPQPRVNSRAIAAVVLTLILVSMVATYHTVSFDFDARQYYSMVVSLLEDHDVDTTNQGLLLARPQFPPGFAVVVAPLSALMDRLPQGGPVDLGIDDLSEMIPESRVPAWQAVGKVYRVPTWKGGHTLVRGNVMVGIAVTSLLMLALGIWVCGRYLCRGSYWIPLLLAVGGPMLLYNATSYLLYASMTAIGLSSCALALYRAQRQPVLTALACGAVGGLLFTIRYEAAVLPIAYVAASALAGQRGRVVWMATGTAPFLIGLMGYNFAVFGNPIANSYDTESLNAFTVSFERLAWYVFDVRSGLLVYSTLAMVSLAGLYRETDRVHVAIVATLLGVYLLRVNLGTDVHTAGLDINRYVLILFPFFTLGLRNLVDRFGRRAIAVAAGIAAMSIPLFFTQFPFHDRFHVDTVPIRERLVRESNFAEPTLASVVGIPPKPVLFAQSVTPPQLAQDLRRAVVFHKYAGYYGFMVEDSATCLRGTLFDTGPHLLVVHLRPCRGTEASWARGHFGTSARPF